MTSTKKTYNLSKIKQLIDLNDASVNFDVWFRATSKNGAPFDILVVDQTTLDNSPELPYKKANNGQMEGSMIQDKNVFQNYFIVLKADQPCECEVEIIKKELPRTQDIPLPEHLGPSGVPQMPGAPGIEQTAKGHMLGQALARKAESNWKTWAIVGILVIGAIILYIVYSSDKKKKAAAKLSATTTAMKASPIAAVASPVQSSYAESPSPVSASPAPSTAGYGGNSLMDRLKRLHMN